MSDNNNGIKVGVVGATGMVGRELIELLERRNFPVASLLPFSSGKNKVEIKFHGKNIDAPAVDWSLLKSCDLVFLVSSDDISLQYGKKLADLGVWVIDDSAAFRLDPKVPLILAEVNADQIKKSQKLIAGPNCTMTGLGVAGALLHKKIGVKEVRLASYQAVSGAGKAALAELFSQMSSQAIPAQAQDEKAPVITQGTSSVLPRAIAYNVIPQVGRFDDNGHSSEENKVCAELKKIWNSPKLKISATTVRVPTIRGHALSAWLTLSKRRNLKQIELLLQKTPGLHFSSNGDYPTPRLVGGKDPVYAGRLRPGATDNEIVLWIVSDNLLKGAALNSIQIAEEILRRDWFK